MKYITALAVILLTIAVVFSGMSSFAQAQPDILRAKGEYEIMSATADIMLMQSRVNALLISTLAICAMLTFGLLALYFLRSHKNTANTITFYRALEQPETVKILPAPRRVDLPIMLGQPERTPENA